MVQESGEARALSEGHEPPIGLPEIARLRAKQASEGLLIDFLNGYKKQMANCEDISVMNRYFILALYKEFGKSLPKGARNLKGFPTSITDITFEKVDKIHAAIDRGEKVYIESDDEGRDNEGTGE